MKNFVPFVDVALAEAKKGMLVKMNKESNIVVRKNKNYDVTSKFRDKGITLIALVVTIIILLILAGITLSSINSNSGIFQKSKQASEAYGNASQEERNTLNTYADKLRNRTNSENTQKPSDTETANDSLELSFEITSSPKNGNTYAEGETISLNLIITNNGNTTLKDIQVIWKDIQVDYTSFPETLSELEPGKSENLGISHSVDESDWSNGQVVFNVEVSAVNTLGKTITSSAKTTVQTEQVAKLQIVVNETSSASHDNGAYRPGESITYQIVCTNIGNVTLNNIVLIFELAGVTLTSGDWNIGTISPGQTSSVINTAVTVTEADGVAGSVVCVVTATADAPNDIPVEVIPAYIESSTEPLPITPTPTPVTPTE